MKKWGINAYESCGCMMAGMIDDPDYDHVLYDSLFEWLRKGYILKREFIPENDRFRPCQNHKDIFEVPPK